jgi:AraC-like DNA-binding protein
LDSGALAGLGDPVVAPALALLHERPAHPWTLAELAQTTATSRMVLAERFTQKVGVPPMHCLSQWQLQLAAEQRATGSENVGTIGLLVGYKSEGAFSRAFKRATSQSPAAWRSSKRGPFSIQPGALPAQSRTNILPVRAR